MLRLAEELLLLLIDKTHGDLASVPEVPLRYALAGAVLMDLALEERIDTDLEHLFIVNATPVGDGLLDPSLAEISDTSDMHDAGYWVKHLARPAVADRLRDRAIDHLVEKRILKRDRGNLLSLARRVVHARRYPTVDGRAEREVELRVMGVLFSDEIPGPRDVMLICLVDACGLFERLLSRAEREEVAERLDLIHRLDSIGRAVFEAISYAGIGQPGKRRDGQVPGAVTADMRTRALAAQPLADGGGIPLVGNALSMRGDLVAFLARQYRMLGPVFRVRAFSRAFTVLAGPDANKLLQRKGRTLFRNLHAFEGVARAFEAHRLVLSMDGSDHFQLRRVLKHGYSRAYMLKRVAESSDIASRVVNGWPIGRPFTVMPAMQRIVGEQIGQLCTGVSPGACLKDLAHYLERTLAVRALHRRPEVMMKTPRMRRARKRIEVLVNSVVQAHAPECRIGKEPDLIDDVLELHRTDPQLLPEHDLLSACIGPFIAGLHTAASVSAFMLYSVLRHPEVKTRMRPEIDELFANGGPTAEKVGAMDVAHRVALETMRLYPVAPVAMRQAVNTFEFGGYTIPAGTHVLVATTVPHRCAEYYPHPERFDIDRYTPERAEHHTFGVYAPFGLGTHRCLGDGFAEVLMVMTLATILHRVDIAMDPSGYRMKIDYLTSATPGSSFRIRILGYRG
ncbi:MAG: cytochrome P450 [Gammaproteobacteria bacterium]|nr:cytochrome P450 [Gammaproteobacteria bacterium]MDE0649166.1 cytochrome P450 [Gammaproteobacteria bacterium]